VIAARHHALAERRRPGKFREDFFDRLRSDVITVPPLRPRLAETQMHGFGGLVTADASWVWVIRSTPAGFL